MMIDILAQVAAWADLAARGCPGVAHAIAPFGADGAGLEADGRPGDVLGASPDLSITSPPFSMTSLT